MAFLSRISEVCFHRPGILQTHHTLAASSWYWRKEQLKRVFSGEDDAISVMRSFNSSYVLIDHDIR